MCFVFPRTIKWGIYLKKSDNLRELMITWPYISYNIFNGLGQVTQKTAKRVNCSIPILYKYKVGSYFLII